MNLNFLKCDKIEEMERLKNSRETQVIVVLHSNFYLNLYYLEENLDMKCFFTNKFLFPINLVEKFCLGLNKTYSKDLPLIALISNSIIKNNQIQFSKNDYLLKIYSIKSKRVVHTLRFKKQIISFVSKLNNFAVSFSDFSIKIYENDKMINIFTIKPQNCYLMSPISPKSEFEKFQENEIVNNTKFFDVSDNFIIYYNDVENLKLLGNYKKTSCNPDEQKPMSPVNKTYSLGSVTMDAFHGKIQVILGLNKLKDWSINQVRDFSNLKKAYSLKNNNELESAKNGCFINLKDLSDVSGEEIKKIFVPFFNEGISIIKFFHASKYFIVGNKNSQIFYIYELYPATNLKNNKTFEYHHRIVYSFYRGLTNASINNIEWSSCKNFLTISSHKGTIHIYYLPKIDCQVFDNHSNFNYRTFQEIYQNVAQAVKIEKIRFGNFFNNNIFFKTYAKILTNFRIEVESLPSELRENLVNSRSERYVNYPILLSLSDNEPVLNLFIIYKEKSLNKEHLQKNDNSNPMKVKEKLVSNHIVSCFKKLSFNLNITNPKIEVEPNYLELIKKTKMLDLSHSIKKAKKLKEQIELETTEKNYAPIQINPLFNFNTYKAKKIEITIQSKFHKKSIDILNNNSNSGSHDHNSNPKISQNSIFQVCSKFDNNESFSQYENQGNYLRNSVTNNNNVTGKRISVISKNENENSQENYPDFQSHKITDLKRKSINNNFSHNNNSNQVQKRNNLTSYYIRKGKTNVSRMRTYSNYEEIENPYNSSINDLIVSEKLLCQDLEYYPKQFKNEKKINAIKSDSIYDNFIYQPKLIIQPNLFFGNNRLPYAKLNSSISDKSSSKDNSLCTINQTTDLSANYGNLQNNNVMKSIHQNMSEVDSSNMNHNSFFRSKENFLENQIKIAMETNIIENFKTNEAQVKIFNEYKIDENYLGK